MQMSGGIVGRKSAQLGWFSIKIKLSSGGRERETRQHEVQEIGARLHREWWRFFQEMTHTLIPETVMCQSCDFSVKQNKHQQQTRLKKPAGAACLSRMLPPRAHT